MNNGVADLALWQLTAAYVFVVIVLFILRLRKIGKEKELLLSAFRMTLQLTLTGYILAYIFENPHPLVTIGVIAVMETFAVFNIYKRAGTVLEKKLKHIIAVAMPAGTLVSLIYFMIVVVGPDPWYLPRYFIPLAGMIIGNSMTGITLGVERLVDGMKSGRDKIEAALMLGAQPREASRQAVNNAFSAAIIPTINSMVGMGIVFLPGMMTGQILSGTSPLNAIEYQIAIMLGILGSVSITVLIFVKTAYSSFFSDRSQLK